MANLDKQVFIALRDVHRKLTHRVQQELEPLNLTSVQANVITKLHRNETMQLSELANSLNMTFPNCSVVCQRLERDGLIERVRDVTDRRIVNLTLTKAGNERFLKLEKVIDEMNAKILKDISDEELEDILAALRRLTRLL